MFQSEPLCRQAIEFLLSTVEKRASIEKFEGKRGEFSFLFRDKKNVTLGHSPMYYSRNSRDYAIRQLEMQASMAIIDTSILKQAVPQLVPA